MAVGSDEKRGPATADTEDTGRQTDRTQYSVSDQGVQEDLSAPSDEGEQPVSLAPREDEPDGNSADAGQGEEQPSQAVLLVNCASVSELSHTPDGNAYATVPNAGHWETWDLRSRSFRRWLVQLFYRQTGKIPREQIVKDALATLEGKALFDGPERTVHIRLAYHEGAIYLDLANDAWQAVEVTPEGWKVVERPPARFRRTPGMLALPTPVAGGSIDELYGFLNVADKDRCLLVAWLVAALCPQGPYPVLALHGEQGSAKSTAAKVLRGLLDPSITPHRSEPRSGRDLMIAATNAWCLCYDNMSHLPPWLSDAFCRLATGGGFATRALYTDGEEVLFQAQRPVMLNGIEELVTRGDLLDRALILYLPRILPERRRTEEQFSQAFEEARPRILGALLDAVSMALRNRDRVELDAIPRMADFAVWAEAAAPAFGWKPGQFLQAYKENREVACALSMESSPVAAAIQQVVQRGPWIGTATELLSILDSERGEKRDDQRAWPRTARGLSGILRRLAPPLRTVGILVQFDRASDHNRTRTIRLQQACISASGASEPSAARAVGSVSDGLQGTSGPHGESSELDDAGRGAEATSSAADEPREGATPPGSVECGTTSNLADGADGMDGADADTRANPTHSPRPRAPLPRRTNATQPPEGADRGALLTRKGIGNHGH